MQVINGTVKAKRIDTIVREEIIIPDAGTETDDYRTWVLLFIVTASIVIYAASILCKYITKRLTKNNMRRNFEDST